MEGSIKWIKANYRELIIVLICFSVFFIFEAYQQLYYARNFSAGTGSDVTIFSILNAHLYRWLIWAVFSLILIYYTYRNPLKRDGMISSQLFRYIVLILGVLFLNLVIISWLNLPRGDSAPGMAAFQEMFIFYFFHKTPLYFIMSVAMIVLVHFFKNREALELTIGELGKLKFSNERLYEDLKRQALNDESFVLQVKTGTRTKLVPVEEIVWIEADDYCVRIYDKSENTHTLRSSMKALVEKLEHYGFVRVHRKAIVNMSFVSEFVQNGKTELILSNNQVVPVAQSRLSALKNAFQTI